MNTFFLIVLGIASVCFIIYEINSSIQIGKAQYRLNKRIKQNSYVISRIREKSKDSLCERICESAVDASEQFLSYLKEDSYLYGKCINDNPIKTTSLIFVINLHREMLNVKYGAEEVFVMTSSMLRSLARDEATYDLFMRSLMEYMKACHECVEFSKNDPDFDVIDVLTKVYFSLVIDDREYLMEELEDSIPQSVSFRKIYNYIYGITNHSVIHQENNMTYLRRTLDIK